MILIMVIIPKDILLKHATTNNVQCQYVSDTGSIFDHQMGRVSCINGPNYFHWFFIDFQVSDFKMSANSQH